MRPFLLVIILFCISLVDVTAQKKISPSDSLFRLMKKGDGPYSRKHYDSAINYFNQAEAYIKKYKLDSTGVSSIIYNAMGDSYRELKNMQQAHNYQYKALLNSRRYNHDYEKQIALTALSNIHRQIVSNDLSFDYPQIAETEKVEMYFPVMKVRVSGDSVDVIVAAGRLDGIIDSTLIVDINTHKIQGDTASHSNSFIYGKARIVTIGNNQTLLRVRRHNKLTLFAGDYAVIKAQVPIRWRQEFFTPLLVKNIYFSDNYKELLYYPRYLYYYGDSLTDAEIIALAKAQVVEVAEVFEEDENFKKQYSDPLSSGLFKGEKLFPALKKSEAEHFRLFINFIKEYPLGYVGNNFKFSEIYATWVINNTPLVDRDIRNYLLRTPPSARDEKALNIIRQVVDNEVPELWIDEALEQTQIDNYKEADKTISLIADYVRLSNDSNYAGWDQLLRAGIQRKLDADSNSQALIQYAYSSFKNADNKIGMSWATTTKDYWKESSRLSVGIQTGHLLSYQIALQNNSRYYATGSMDNSIKIWDRSLGKEIVQIDGHEAEVNSIQYSPNGRYLVSTSEDSTIKVWNAYNFREMYSYRTSQPEQVAIFSPDSKSIISAGKDSLIKIRDLKTNKITKTLALHKGRINDLFYHPTYNYSLFSCGSDSMIYEWDLQTGEMEHWWRQKGKVLSIEISKDGNYMSAISTDSLITVWDIVAKKKLFWSPISVHKTGSITYYGESSFSPDSRYISFPYARDSFYFVRLSDLKSRTYWTNESDNYLEELKFTPDGLSLLARFANAGLLRTYNISDWDIEKNTTIVQKDSRSYASLTAGVQFINNDNELVVTHSEISRIDLRNGSKERMAWLAEPFLNRKVLQDNGEVITAFDSSDYRMVFYNYKKKETIRYINFPGSKIKGVAGNDDITFLFGANSVIGGWKANQSQPLFMCNWFSDRGREVYAISHDSIHHRLYVTTETDNVYILDAARGILIDSIEIENASHVIAGKQFLYVTTSTGWLKKYDVRTYQLIKEMRVNRKSKPASQPQLTRNEESLVLINEPSSLMMIDTKNDSIRYQIADQPKESLMLSINQQGDQMATVGLSGTVSLYKVKTGDRISTIFLPLDKDMMILDNEGHYLSSKQALEAITITLKNKAYSFDQFDIQLNRPDIVLKKLGHADSSLLKAYRDAYVKRLQKLKINSSRGELNFQLPVIRLKDRFDVSPVTTLDTFSIEVECSDNFYALQSIQVLVNNVPLFDKGGLQIKQPGVKQYQQRIRIPLSTGNNNIKVFCTNSEGASSLRETFDIISKYQPKKQPTAYFIGIGVSDYKDKSMNLRYAAKDIRDLSKTFWRLKDTLIIDTLINSRVTRAGILALKRKLMQTTVNDQVILAVTGHGLLSDSLDFYYATWDVDFKHPEKKGVRYEELEDLLTGIPARQKLMIIDACHSGALDKEELMAIKQQQISSTLAKNDTSKIQGFASRGTITENTEAKLVANSSFELMQNLFTDYSNSNGAIIISAAGGMEYAFESPTWNNGVFTYAFRKGLEDKMADYLGNYDRRITVQELAKYVSATVLELTNGKQKPVSRMENIDNDWPIRTYRE